jgi:hypothetical protein
LELATVTEFVTPTMADSFITEAMTTQATVTDVQVNFNFSTLVENEPRVTEPSLGETTSEQSVIHNLPNQDAEQKTTATLSASTRALEETTAKQLGNFESPTTQAEVTGKTSAATGSISSIDVTYRGVSLPFSEDTTTEAFVNLPTKTLAGVSTKESQTVENDQIRCQSPDDKSCLDLVAITSTIPHTGLEEGTSPGMCRQLE